MDRHTVGSAILLSFQSVAVARCLDAVPEVSGALHKEVETDEPRGVQVAMRVLDGLRVQSFELSY